MSIFRVIKDKENPYVMMNKYALQDETLSWKAKGLLAYLLSLPDDWKIYEEELLKHAKDQKGSLSTGIKELIKAGYIKRKRIRNEKGQLKDSEYQVYEVPTYTGKSYIGKTKVGESATTNNYLTDINCTDKNNKGISKRNTVRAFSLDKYISSLKGDVDKDKYSAISYYLEEYERYMGNKHPALKAEQWDRVIEQILYCPDVERDLDVEEIEKMIDRHFITNYKNCDYNILHFLGEEIKNNRFYEEVK